MTITKYEHSCLDIEEQGKRLIIDPGDFATSLTDFNNIEAVVITHVHFDHCNAEKVQAIISANPAVKIFTTGQVAEKLGADKVIVARAGQTETVGPFSLQFFGGTHAIIHPSMPPDQNIGVLVNNSFYYAGDSFDPSQQTVDVLAVPAHAPWMKIAEVMDFIAEIKPRWVFPTHNIFLSDLGQELVNNRLSATTEENGGQYKYLAIGQALDTSS